MGKISNERSLLEKQARQAVRAAEERRKRQAADKRLVDLPSSRAVGCSICGISFCGERQMIRCTGKPQDSGVGCIADAYESGNLDARVWAAFRLETIVYDSIQIGRCNLVKE